MEEIIMDRLHCTAKEAAQIAEDLALLHDDLKPFLTAWLENQPVNYDKEYNGYSLNSLMEGFGMQFTGALLTLDWLVKDPKAASNALAYGIR